MPRKSSAGTGMNHLNAGTRQKKVLMVCHDVMGEQMAGPAIRALELGRVLSRSAEVTLAAAGKPSWHDPDLRIVGFEPENCSPLEEAASQSEVIIASGSLLADFPFLISPTKPLVVDIYDPFVLENLEIHSREPLQAQIEAHRAGMRILCDQLRVGDYFICASEEQKDFWLGLLTSLGRVNPLSYKIDRTMDSLIGVVPFGVPKEPPVHRKPVLKGVVPGIGSDDKVLLWGGGLWEWFDPLTLIRAMQRISLIRLDVKLFFMSKTHPNSSVAAQMGMPQKAETLARELGLLSRSVFFSDRWVPYAERENFLLEADIGVSTHFRNIETRYSFRTRILDYIWAGLPIVSTTGDSMSEIVESRGLGTTVAPEDVDGLAEAILTMVANLEFRRTQRETFRIVAKEFEWGRVARPLVDFCADPRKSPSDESPVEFGESPDLKGRLEQLSGELREMENQVQRYRDMVAGYRRGKVMRSMEAIHSLRLKWWP